MTTVYLYLLDEAVDVWRPVEAVKVPDQGYRIVTENEHPDDEHWQFHTGDVVHCEERRGCLVAVALAKRT